jgi:hypothetical protein
MENKPSLVREIINRYQLRKASKKIFDSQIKLSVKEGDREYSCLSLANNSDDGWLRLLDEGSIIDQYGTVYMYIPKGMIQEMYDKFGDDEIGTISLGHMDYSTFPFFLGEWSKKDLRVIDIEDGRQALEVRPNFNDDSFIIQELKRSDAPLGISSEFYHEYDKKLGEELGVYVIANAQLRPTFAIVGEAGNVNSGDLKLKGVSNMSLFNKKDNKNVEESAAPVQLSTEEFNEIVEAVEAMEKMNADVEALNTELSALREENEALRSQLSASEEVVEESRDNNETTAALLARFSVATKALKELFEEEKKQEKKLNVKDAKKDVVVSDVHNITDGIGAARLGGQQ